MIEFNAVRKSYGQQIVIDDLSFKLQEGLIHVLIGPSGCGKTTLLEMMNGLQVPDRGTITINGLPLADRDLISLRRQIGYVIQEVGLFPHFSVFDNIALVPRLLKWSKDHIQSRVLEMLDLVAVEERRASDYPHQLSGGQQQRIGVARALASDPQILLMDEPFSAIDPINRLRLQDAFLTIQKQLRKTVVFVTHDLNEAVKMGDRILLLNEGKIEQAGNPLDLLRQPANSFVREFIGEDRFSKLMDVLTVGAVMSETVAGTDGDSEILSTSLPLKLVIEKLLRHPENSFKIEKGQKIIGSLSLKDIQSFLSREMT